MIYVLLIIFAPHTAHAPLWSKDAPVSGITQEFSSEETCLVAKKTLIEKLKTQPLLVECLKK